MSVHNTTAIYNSGICIVVIRNRFSGSAHEWDTAQIVGLGWDEAWSRQYFDPKIYRRNAGCFGVLTRLGNC
jgi:hypothetical protein